MIGYQLNTRHLWYSQRNDLIFYLFLGATASSGFCQKMTSIWVNETILSSNHSISSTYVSTWGKYLALASIVPELFIVSNPSSIMTDLRNLLGRIQAKKMVLDCWAGYSAEHPGVLLLPSLLPKAVSWLQSARYILIFHSQSPRFCSLDRAREILPFM